MYIIYSIHRIGTDQHYVGYTNNLSIRRNGHRYHLNNGRHHNFSLQQDWLDLGEPAFEFIILDEIQGSRLDAKSREAEWIARVGTYNEMVANKSKTGTTMNERLRTNMATHLRRRHFEGDPRIKAGLQKAQIVANTKASERMKNKWSDPEFAEYQSTSLTDRWREPIFRETMALAQQERWAKPDEHLTQRNALLKGWQSRERKNGLPRGVTRSASKIEKYAASIWYDGKAHHLGVFDTIELASIAYKSELDQRSTTKI